MGTKHVFLVFVDKKWPSKIVNKQAQYLDYKRKWKKKQQKLVVAKAWTEKKVEKMEDESGQMEKPPTDEILQIGLGWLFFRFLLYFQFSLTIFVIFGLKF